MAESANTNNDGGDDGSALKLTPEDIQQAWDKTKKRSQKEEKLLGKKAKAMSIDGVSRTVDGKLKTVTFKIKFKGKGSYAKASFTMQLVLPSGYPFQAPANISFLHDVYHPSVHPDTKEICPHVLGLEEWKPTKKVSGIVQSMQNAFENIPIEGALNESAAEQFAENQEAFKKELKSRLKKKKYKLS